MPRERRLSWADLLRRVYKVDVHCCSGSGCQTDTPADCKGTAGGSSCSGSEKMAADSPSDAKA